MSKRICDMLPPSEILAQMAEEASELAQAALKLRRTLDGKNPTPVSGQEATANFLEELADIQVCTNAFFEKNSPDYAKDLFDAIDNMETKKHARWLKRLEERYNAKCDVEEEGNDPHMDA